MKRLLCAKGVNNKNKILIRSKDNNVSRRVWSIFINNVVCVGKHSTNVIMSSLTILDTKNAFVFHSKITAYMHLLYRGFAKYL